MQKYSLIVLLLLFSCNNIDKPKATLSIEKFNDTIEESSLENQEIIDSSEIDCYNPFNGIVRWETLVNSILVIDTFYSNNQIPFFNNIKGIVKNKSKYNVTGTPRKKYLTSCNYRLFPTFNSKQEFSVIDNKYYYLPFRLSNDLEESIITIWKVLDEQTIEYVSYFKNIIGTKYSRVLPINEFIFKKVKFLIVKNEGGEEGEYSEELFYYQLKKDTIVSKIYLTNIGGRYLSDTLKTLTSLIKKDSIIVFEQKWLNNKSLFSQKVTLRKKIEIKSSM